MKKKIKYYFFGLSFFAVITLLTISGCGYSQIQSSNNGNDSSYYNNYNAPNDVYGGLNYDQTLNEYGDWIMIAPYGNVWKPFVSSNWQPFYYGHWVYTQYGWTWVSYEPFGWIVYHYGNWVYNQFYGWIWIPSENQWSPARVQWDDFGNYIGWAPLPYNGITYGNPWEENHHYWHVVPDNDFTQNDLNNRYVDPSSLRNMGGRNSVEHRAPEVSRIERRTSTPVNKVTITREKVKSTNLQAERMRLPNEQQKIIRNHAPEIQRNVIQPRHQNYNPNRNEIRNSGARENQNYHRSNQDNRSRNENNRQDNQRRDTSRTRKDNSRK